MKDALDRLKVPNTAARALLVKCRTTVERLVVQRPTELDWYYKALVAADAPALRNVLKSEALARVKVLRLQGNNLADEGAAAIAAAAAAGGMPRLEDLGLSVNQIGDAGMQALASASASGAFRELEVLYFGGNNIGAGLAALAAALEKGALPALKALSLCFYNIGDAGVEALVKALEKGNLPSLMDLFVDDVHTARATRRAAGPLRALGGHACEERKWW